MQESGNITMSFDDHEKLGALIAKAQDVVKYMYVKPALVIPQDFLPEAKGLIKLAGYDVVRGHQFAVVIPVEVQ